ncbi:MerR family transcriptional regulator [Rhizobiaceae bacterium BDR2-2]|uniref:MerR family transcriptional regulator n=1 Tax=Ectorhizobium quercum TaxID=2965071 RepID=A0AAE3N2P9_9HYPH|nr:MerR family transcriptional regulator [Ectorhizobium quercum]MCX8999748.1 MerR family transcriptional regulator [Ectorhizobium quercum]
MDDAARLNADRTSEPKALHSARKMPQIGLPDRLPPEPLTIADMAELFGVTHRTLHFYEEKGLISSERAGAMRVYGHDDVTRMAVVSACREGGMPVAVIQDMLGAMDEAATPEQADAIFRDTLVSCKRELTAGISTIRRQMQQIENLLNQVVPDHPAADETHPALTEREIQCLKMMADGLSIERIAAAFAITPLEADALEKDVIARLGAANRSQSIAKALIAGLISD